MNIEEIRRLAELLSEYNLGSLEVEDGEVSIKLTSAQTSYAAQPLPAYPAPAGEAEPKKLTGKVVISPIVGVFFSAPSPGAEPFVTVGKRVGKGDTLCIVEAMKMMSDILSEFDGEVASILVEDGQVVEFGQPLMTLI